MIGQSKKLRPILKIYKIVKGIYMKKTSLLIIFLIITCLRFLSGIFNISFIANIYNTIFSYMFIIIILYIVLRFRKEKTNIARFIKYFFPVIIIGSSLVFTNIFTMINPYIFYFILSFIILPLFENHPGWENTIRIMLVGVMIPFIIFIVFLSVLFKDFGKIDTRDELIFTNNTSKKLIVVQYDHGALGGSTALLYEQVLGKTGLKCEKQITVGRWGDKYDLELIYQDITKTKIGFCGINIRTK